MEDSEELQKKTYSQIVPTDWFQLPDKSSVWVTVYSAPSVSKTDMHGKSKAVDFPDSRVRAILCFGKFKYLDASGFKHEFVGPDGGRIQPNSVAWRETPEAVYLMCLAPFVVDGFQRNEAEVRNDLGVVVALFVSILGRRVAFEHLYDNEVNVATGETSVFSPAFENPWWEGFGTLDVGDSRFLSLAEAGSKLGSVPKATRERIRLSLRWFVTAVRDTGVDAYLKCWIALETLAMHTTNINPLNDTLAAAYKMSSQQAKQYFRVGRLVDLRSRIVHKGYQKEMDAWLLKYVESIYIDVLFQKLGLECEKRAKAVLDEESFDLSKYFPKS